MGEASEQERGEPTMLLKALCIIFLGIGAFLVYGARFVAAKVEEQKPEEQRENSTPAVVSEEMDEEILKKMPPRGVLKIKMIGMAFVLGGVLLALVAFK